MLPLRLRGHNMSPMKATPPSPHYSTTGFHSLPSGMLSPTPVRLSPNQQPPTNETDLVDDAFNDTPQEEHQESKVVETTTEGSSSATQVQTNSSSSSDSSINSSSNSSSNETSAEASGAGDAQSVASGAASSSSNPSKQWACDICANVTFDTEMLLDQHMQQRHAGLCSQHRQLRELVLGKIQPVWNTIVASGGGEMPAALNPDVMVSRWERWGEKAFAIASQRDGGLEKITEAHNARAQLEILIQKWNPDAKVFVFGSSVVMGVWDGMSDIDYMVVNVLDMERGVWPPNEKNAVRALTELLKKAGFKYTNLEPVQHARVPIIKNHAAVPLFNSISKEAEDVISRSVRWVFVQPLSIAERVRFEAGLREAVSEVVGGKPASSATAGGTAPGQPGANGSGSSDGAGQPREQSAILQLWWHSDHTTCSATFLNTTVAVKAIVHSPCVPASLLRRVGPLHDDFQPELFKIDFDLGFRPFGVRNSFLLRNYLNSHACARPGAIVLKDWSKSSGVNNSIGGYYTSYAVNIMWIYYLVQKGVVPYIDPNSIPSSLVDCHDYNPRYVPIVPPEMEKDAGKRQAMYRQMGELLAGFFAFYGFEFNWDEHVISLNRNNDEPTLKEDLKWIDPIVVQGKKSTRYLQCIEDPYEDNLNLGRHIGDGRRWKVMQEFYRGLVSLLKDDADSCCVFEAHNGTNAAAMAPAPAAASPTVPESVTGSVNPEHAPAATKIKKPPAVRNPSADDMLLLTGVCVQCVERSTEGFVTESDLRRYIAEYKGQTGGSAGTPQEALERALAVWPWDKLIRQIGYKQIGGRVYSRRLIGARPAKVPVETPTGASPDLSEQLLRSSTSTVLDKPPNAPPEWVMWTPPTYSVPNSSSNSNSSSNTSSGGGGGTGSNSGAFTATARHAMRAPTMPLAPRGSNSILRMAAKALLRK